MSTPSTPHPSLWSKISNFFHTAEVKVSAVFIALFGKQAATQFAQASLALLKSAEGKIVLDAVEAVQSLAGSGADKRNAAFTQIMTDLKAQGKSVAESEINMLIELAVQFLKGNIAPAQS